MNRTKIEWTDYTWNPVTGCWGPGGTAEKPNHCWYCYAKRVHSRFEDKNYNDPLPKKWGYSFAPTFHPERLFQPAKVKKSAKIFVCSMGDLFGDWVPDEWIQQIKDRVRSIHNRQHTFQFLTKNPKRYQEFNPWPSNCWVGTTVTNQADADKRVRELLFTDAPVRFVSIEPMLSEIDSSKWFKGVTKGGYGSWGKVNWTIIGAMTGLGSSQHQPKPEWIQSLIDQAHGAGVPVFLKDNLHWPEKIQEWPG